MAEKKIVTFGLRMEEPMMLTLKRLAEADGLTESELVRNLISGLIEERRDRYIRLHSIFGEGCEKVEGCSVQQRTTDE